MKIIPLLLLILFFSLDSFAVYEDEKTPLKIDQEIEIHEELNSYREISIDSVKKFSDKVKIEDLLKKEDSEKNN